jgi:minor curlin subunit
MATFFVAPLQNKLLALLVGACCGHAVPVQAADLSMLSDFGRPDIPVALTKGAVSSGDVAGISQNGSRNGAYIEQVGRVGNNAESWQEGSDLAADITQRGASNALRLLQNGANDSATLLQNGIGNQMAIQQLGADVSATSSQVGDGNQLVLVQQAHSQFTSTQTGNQNQLLVDLPSGVFMAVEQTGSNLFLRVAP